MARKDLLRGLMQAPAPDPEGAILPRYDRGAIGAVSRGIGDLKRRAVIDVPPDLIDNGGLRDRLDHDPEGIAALAASIRDYGQQVPVMLRHHANIEGRYEVVYGRRRVAAQKLLRQPVKAMVREMDDRDLVIAQGQENSARKDLTFIEKALFAQQMVKSGYDRKIICDALSIDKTVISRMLAVLDALPQKLILAIGAAPSIGRDRWLSMAQRARGADLAAAQRAAVAATSDARFEQVMRALTPSDAGSDVGPDVGSDAVRQIRAENGALLGQARPGPRKIVIELTGQGREFGEWLADHLPEIHRNWLDSKD